MTQNVSMSPVFSATQLFNNGGAPLNGGYIHTYIAGTLNNATTYSDNLGTVPNANPIVLDTAGRSPEIWLVNGVSYDLVLASGTVVLQTARNVVGVDQLSTSVYTPPVTTNGDIFIYNNGPTRLPIGTTGQVLTVSGGEPTWLAASGGLPTGPVVKPTASQFPTLINPGSYTAPGVSDTTTGIYMTSNVTTGSNIGYQAIVQPIGTQTDFQVLVSSIGAYTTTPGIIFYETSSGKAVSFTYFGHSDTTGNIIVCYWNGNTRTGYNFVPVYPSSQYLWHRVTLQNWVGVPSLVWWGTGDGVNWEALQAVSIASYFNSNPDKWGLCVGQSSGGSITDAATFMSVRTF